MTRLVVSCLTLVAALSIHPQTLRAQMPGQGSPMPDPKAMSGIPLPVADLPVGTVTARVIRGALTNPLKGETVQLSGPGVSTTATTDESGRATFTAIAAGTRVKAAVVVNGERVESQEFEIPTTGGVRVMLVSRDEAAEQQAAEDRKLRQSPAVRGAVALGEQSRFVIEAGDDALNVFNILQIVNTAQQPVDGGGPLVFELPAWAVGAGVLEGSAPNAVVAGRRVTVTGPFAPGDTVVQFAYSVPLGSETIVLAQTLPVQMTKLAVVVQKIGEMQLTSPQVTQRREMAADGQTYIVGQGGPVKAGDTVTLTLSDLPHRATWPRNVALLLAVAIIGAGAWGASRRGSPQQASRRQQLQTRRDRLFAELAALEEQRRTTAMDPRAYATRREQLVTALEDLYAGLDRESAA